MPENRDDVNLGNPSNARRDVEERNDAKVTNADHPVSEIGGGRARGSADDVFDDSVPKGASEQKLRDERGRSTSENAAPPAGVPIAGGSPPIVTILPATATGIAASTHSSFDIHSETVRDSEIEMPGETTNKADPFSGETGMHPVGVGFGAAAGGAAGGAMVGLAAGAVAGPLGAAIGAAVGTTLGAIGGGYTGKHIAERVNPTTENHYWRHAYASREYVTRGDKYEKWLPAYEYGIDMREWLLDKTWEESEPMIRSGWEQSEAGAKMPWEQAKPAIMDAWHRLTPEPGEPEVTDEERRAEE